MKKLLFQTLALLSFGQCLHSQFKWHEPPSPFDWHGPYYESYWANTIDYHKAVSQTTLGTLARFSDVIGVGKISDWDNGRFTITVDHALVGCTNGASILVHETKHAVPTWPDWEIKNKNDFMPTNHSRIVFAVYTNDFGTGNRMYWNSPVIPRQPYSVLKNYEMRWLNRSWWYFEHDDGVLFTQFTNVIQAVRFDRNWTNYFHLCRDGATSKSVRVQEDSFWDLRYLCILATPERGQYMLADPLVDSRHKTPYLNGVWSTLIPDP